MQVGKGRGKGFASPSGYTWLLQIWETDNAKAIKAGNAIVLSLPIEHLASVTSDFEELL